MPILHLTRTIPALVPRYVSRFSCIGPQCEDTCCVGWKVYIDKKTFNSYRQSRHPTLGEAFAKNFARNRTAGTDRKYGVIKLSPETGACTLMQDGLCSVHRELGDSHLSDTCFIYPRSSRVFNGQHEQSLTLSCPEAARQALLSPDAFEFIEGSITIRANTVAAITAKHGLSLDLMNEVRIFCMNLIRTADLAIWQRLAVLGTFCEALTAHLESGQQSKVRGLVDSYVQMVEQGMVPDALGNLQPDHGVQAVMFASLWGGRRRNSRSPIQNDIGRAIIAGLGIDPRSGQVSNDQLISNYKRGVERLQEALEAAPHLLENYLMNELFSLLFPFNAKRPFDDYLKLVWRFGLLRLMLAAQCNTEDPLPDVDRLVHTVHVFYRSYQHDDASPARLTPR